MLKSVIHNLLLSPDAPASVETPPPSTETPPPASTEGAASEEVHEGAAGGEEQQVEGEVEGESTVTLDDFLGAKSKPLTTDDIGLPKPAKLPEGEKKKEEEKVVPPDKKEGQPLRQIAPVKKFPASRDYTGIPEADVPMFQRMSNEAYEKFRPMYDSFMKQTQEIATLKEQVSKIPQAGRMPDSYYEHPAAYVLSPEYSQAVIEANEAQSVLEHWRLQLDEVRNGAQEYQTLVRDPQTGQIMYGAKVAVDQRTQSQLENIFMNANSQANTYQQKMGAIKETFARTHKSAIADLNAYEKAFFSPYEDPKHPMVPAIQDTLKQMHPSFRSNPMAPFVAKSIVTINALLNLLKANGQKTQQEKVKEKVTAAQRKAGPIATGAGAGTEEGKEDEVTMDDFLKVKES
jgi:hypothetical protein